MEVILLERISRLGQMGDTVKVKDGFARNFLLPQGKALRANEANKKKFEGQRAQLEARNLERKSDAGKIAGSLDGKSFVVVRSAGETGQLYGSVSTRDIATAVTEAGYTVDRRQIMLDQPIKSLGLYKTRVALHPEVVVQVTVNVAQSAEEAEMQAAGRTAGQPAVETAEPADGPPAPVVEAAAAAPEAEGEPAAEAKPKKSKKKKAEE